MPFDYNRGRAGGGLPATGSVESAVKSIVPGNLYESVEGSCTVWSSPDRGALNQKTLVTRDGLILCISRSPKNSHLYCAVTVYWTGQIILGWVHRAALKRIRL